MCLNIIQRFNYVSSNSYFEINNFVIEMLQINHNYIMVHNFNVKKCINIVLFY